MNQGFCSIYIGLTLCGLGLCLNFIQVNIQPNNLYEGVTHVNTRAGWQGFLEAVKPILVPTSLPKPYSKNTW